MTQAFNLSQFANNVNTSGQASLTAAVSGTLPVANGGTGAVSLTANNVILGNGTGAVQTVAPSTSGNVLQSNGSTWVSATFAPYSGFSTVIFTTSTTWSVPTGITQARITVIGGGGGGTSGSTAGTSGGAGGLAIAYCTGLNGTLTITVGTGGASAVTSNTAASPGTASSVTGTGVSISASGGTGAVNSTTQGTNGAGSVTTGTALSSGAAVINGFVRGGTSSSVTSADNAFNNYIGGSIAIAKNQAVDNPTVGGAGQVFSVGGQSPAGSPGYYRNITKSTGGLVIIEY